MFCVLALQNTHMSQKKSGGPVGVFSGGGKRWWEEKGSVEDGHWRWSLKHGDL